MASSPTMNMKQILMMAGVMLGVTLAIKILPGLSWLLWPMALILWALVVLWVLHHAGKLPAGLSAALSRMLDAKAIASREARVQQVERLKGLTPDAILASEAMRSVIGHADAKALIAERIAAHVVKLSPSRPLSISLMGPPAAGKESLINAFASACGVRPIRIDVSDDISLNWEWISNAISSCGGLAIVHVHDAHHGAKYSATGSLIAGLTSLLERGTVPGSSASLSHAVIFLNGTITEDEASGLPLQMTEREKVAKTISTRLLNAKIASATGLHVGLRPLSDPERAGVIWRAIAIKAEREHGLAMANVAPGPAEMDLLLRLISASRGSDGFRTVNTELDSLLDPILAAAARQGSKAVTLAAEGQTFRAYPAASGSTPVDLSGRAMSAPATGGSQLI
jgi:hypothetical protein